MTDSAMSATASGREHTLADVRASVRAVVIELAPNRDALVGPETTLIDDLGYHSLALTELAFTLEDEFDLEPIEEVTARRINTLGAVERHVVQQLAARGEIVDGP